MRRGSSILFGFPAAPPPVPDAVKACLDSSPARPILIARDPDALARQDAANLGIEPVPAEDEGLGIGGASRLVPDWPGPTGDNQ